VNPDDLRPLYDQHQRIHLAEPLSVREEVNDTVRYVWHHEKAGAVLHSRLTAATADAAIQGQIDYFRGLGYSFEWKHYAHDSPPDMVERLVRHGLAADEPEAVMVLDLADPPRRLLAPVALDVRRATTPQDFAAADRVHRQVWGGQPDEVSRMVWPRYAADPDTVSLYVAYHEGEPASFGRVEFPHDNPFAGIWGGSTVPGHRGRGLYTALVAARLQEALRRGRRYLTVDAMPETSMPILQALGFVTISYATAFNGPPA
jgi:GNAT superfamily N-acetyltransferase